MPNLPWYWHRLRAMSPGEVALHVRKKLRQISDARRQCDSSGVKLDCSGAFPKLPKPELAPEVLRDALRRDAADILEGRWKAFGHLELQVDDPPRWHKDYLAGKDLATDESAFTLDYRELPDGADIKLIWELSRWHQLVRLAMAAYVLGDRRAGEKCVEWLEDWVKHNPPYRGWNWTSALEAGMRLVQFTWIDALLSSSSRGDEAHISMPVTKTFDQSLLTSTATMEDRLERLRHEILPPHVWYAWRHKSFGSSANNHLIGELAGLILATVRWPALAKWGASLDELQARWEREVLAQFAEDGGNREQALNYHLFSWEFCWQTRMALAAIGMSVSPHVKKRLSHAAAFEVSVRPDTNERWDYGDSDDAFVTPFFSSHAACLAEWHGWMVDSPNKSAIRYWLGESPLSKSDPEWVANIRGGEHFSQSGIVVLNSPPWVLRWDLSPLGYLATGAHGHLDALHVSIWFKGVPVVVDPGTGAYHADKRLRAWLASRAAHNGPCAMGVEFPRRLGSFLWECHHARPLWDDEYPGGAWAALKMPDYLLQRTIVPSQIGMGWEVRDGFSGGHPLAFQVRWQFAPGSWVKRISERKFSIHRANVAVVIEVDGTWAEVELIEPVAGNDQSLLTSAATESLEGIVSPAFRKLCRAPYLKLVARPQGDKPCVFTTTFLACAG